MTRSRDLRRPVLTLALEAGSLFLGAVVALAVSTRGQISIVTLAKGLATSAMAAAPRAALAVAAFLGIGVIVVRHFQPLERRRLSRLEWGFLAWVVGLLSVSQVLCVLGILGLYRPTILLGVQVVGVLVLTGHVFRAFPGRAGRVGMPPESDDRPTRLLLLALVGAVAGAYLAQALGTRLIKWDALQYHLGLPRWYLRLGGFEHFPSHPKSGIYLGLDVLYGTVLTVTEPLRVAPAKLLSWAFGLTAILAVYLLARRLGATRNWALVATLGMATVPAIANWGLVKNDLAAAGVALAALWLLAVAFEEREPGLSLWIGLCLGYAVTVKVTMILAAPVVLLATAWRFGWAAGLRCALGLAAPLVLWASRAWWLQGTLLFPALRAEPEYVRDLWTLRNANGLTLSPGSFLYNAIPLLLNTTGRVPINYSLGVPSLIAIALAIPAACRHGAARVACLAAGTLLLVMMLHTFEGRLLNRYLLLAPAVAFPTACAWLSSRSSAPLWRKAMPLTIALGLLAAYARTDSIFDVLRQRRVLASIAGGGARPDDRLASQLALVRRAESLLEPGETLLISNAAIYLLDRPFVNANALHSTVFRYDKLDAKALALQLRSMGVGAGLIRKNIPGYQPQLREVIRLYGRPVAGPKGMKAYDFCWDKLDAASEVESPCPRQLGYNTRDSWQARRRCDRRVESHPRARGT